MFFGMQVQSPLLSAPRVDDPQSARRPASEPLPQSVQAQDQLEILRGAPAGRGPEPGTAAMFTPVPPFLPRGRRPQAGASPPREVHFEQAMRQTWPTFAAPDSDGQGPILLTTLQARNQVEAGDLPGALKSLGQSLGAALLWQEEPIPVLVAQCDSILLRCSDVANAGEAIHEAALALWPHDHARSLALLMLLSGYSRFLFADTQSAPLYNLACGLLSEQTALPLASRAQRAKVALLQSVAICLEQQDTSGTAWTAALIADPCGAFAILHTLCPEWMQKLVAISVGSDEPDITPKQRLAALEQLCRQLGE